MRYRHLRRTVIAVLAAIAFFLTVAMVARHVLDSAAVRNGAIRTIQRVAAARGIDLAIEDLRWELFPPRVVLTRVAATGPGISAEVDRVEADLARVRVARRTIELGTVAARGITVRLDEIPRAALTGDGSLIRLAIRQLDLRDIRFEGHNLPGKLDVDLEGFAVSWTSVGDLPSGFVSVDQARVVVPGLEPFTAAVQSRIVIDEGIRLPGWKIDGDGISIRGSGRIGDGSVRLDLEGTAILDVLDDLLRTGVDLGGTMVFSGRIDTGADDLVTLDVSSPLARAAGFPAEDVQATLIVARDSLNGTLHRATFNGGRIGGKYRLDHLSGPTRPHTVHASGDGVSVAGLLEDLGVPTAGVAARMAVEVDLAWNGRSINSGKGTAVVLLSPDAGELPAEGRLDVALTSEGLLRFSAEDLSLGSSAISWQGPLTLGSWQPNWSIRASHASLNEVVSLVNGLVEQELLPAWISGIGDLQVSLSGPWNQLVVRARLDARPLLLPPIVLDQLVTEFTIADSRLRLGPTRFRVTDGHGEVDGSVAWGETAGAEQLDLGIRGFRIPLATVARWGGAEGQFDGVISFTGGLRGQLASPRGSWAVGLDAVSLVGRELGGGTATVDLAGGRFDARGLRFEQGLQGGAWWDVGDGVVGGHMEWPEMPVAAFGSAATRLAGDTAHLSIDFEMPHGGALSGKLHAESPSATFDVTASDQDVDFQMDAAQAITVTGSLHRNSDGLLKGDGRLELSSAENLVRLLVPESKLPLTGTAAGTFRMEWPAGDGPQASGTIQDLDLQLETRPIRLLAPARFLVSPGGFELLGLNAAIRDDELFVRFAADRDGSLTGNLAGTLDALLLRFLLPDWEPAGRATAVVELLGSSDLPRFEGIAEVHQVSFRLPKTQTILSGIDGTILFSSEDVTLEGVDFRFMQGRGRTSGRIGRRGGVIDLALDGSVDALRYTVLPDLTTQLSGTWRLVGPVDDLELSGDMTVDGASLRSKEDIATLLLKWFGGDTKPPPEAGGIALDLHVDADETIELRNPSLRLVGSASLDISGNTNRPGLVGKLEFAEGGEVTLQTLRYEVERASFTFSDPDLIDPFVDIQARTWVQNYDVSLRITGTQDRLIPSVSSNPPLTEDQIYGLMALGRRTQSVGGAGAMGVGFASSILSGQLASEFDRRAGFALPVDQVRVDPFAETATGETGGARITLVKQLTKSWTVTLQSNLSGAQDQAIVSRWYLAPGIFIEASQNIEGSYGIDLLLRRPY